MIQPYRGSKSCRTNLRLETLERREVLSVTNLWTSGASLIVQSNNSATNVEVHKSGSSIAIKEVGTAKYWYYTGVSKVEFQGGAGDDRFVNFVDWLPVLAFGAGGNDHLEGYNGSDQFLGGLGNDKIMGYGGDDMLWGEAGNDVLLAGSGNDQLMGGPDNDRLNGRAGNDKFWGGFGSDVIIAIDNVTGDEVQGGPDNDIVWVDRNSNISDPIWGAESGDKTQYVSWFNNNVDRTLDGDKIVDPYTKSGHVYKSFDGNPLFAANGPTMGDVRQGVLSDCWMLAGVGAIASDNPFAIRSHVVNFDDGTYGVRLGNNVYRVDSDLPVTSASSTAPAYAQLGLGNSMWVAVVEKAYAHYRYGANSYPSIENGWSVDVNKAFGTTAPGDYAINGYSSSTSLANEIWNRWNNYEAVTIGFAGGWVASGAPLVNGHMYNVYSVTRNSAGVVTSITLRNPWGVDGAGSDGSNDGLVTVTPAQIFGSTGRLNWGWV